MIGVVTEDPELVARLKPIVEAAGCTLVFANTKERAEQVLTGTGWRVRLIDYGANFIDVATGCRFMAGPAAIAGRAGLLTLPTACARTAVDFRSRVVLVRGDAWSTKALEIVQAVVCPRGDYDRIAEELAGLLPRPATAPNGPHAILGDSLHIRRVRDEVRLLGRFPDMPVLVLGETGSGKELAAHAIHDVGGGPGRPFVAINCAAIPENLFEAELFGSEAGAFTGATRARSGLLEAAAGGTLFLDEIGEMPASLQPKLLRAIESGEFRRVGAVQTLPFRARIVSATNRAVTADNPGSLRPDLFFRLAGFTLTLPPLRERREDIAVIANAFLASFVARYALGRRVFSEPALDRLARYAWPGNVRELRTVIGRLAMTSRDELIDLAEVELALRQLSAAPGVTAENVAAQPAARGLKDLEKVTILEAWTASGRNLSRAARALAIPRTTLRTRLRRYGAL